jgi:Ca-activated chloride channel family protein
MKIGAIVFAATNYWWSGIIVLTIIGLSLYLLWWKKSIVNLLVSSVWRPALLKNFSLYRLIIKTILLSMGSGLLFIALLRPKWGMQEQQVVQHGRDLFIALDISRSMLARDVLPDRLLFAKNKIRTLLAQLSSERVGLILFSGSAFIQCPLTSDYNAFYLFLDQVDTEIISSGTTAIDGAIKQALDAFNRMPLRQHKLLVLLTDGEDFSSNLASIKEEAFKQGMMIFALGVGSIDGAPIPLVNAQGLVVDHQKDRHGNVVISKLNEGIIRSLAQDSGGTYIRTVADNSDIAAVVNKVHAVEKEKIEDKTISIFKDQYHWFALASFILLSIEWLL